MTIAVQESKESILNANESTQVKGRKQSVRVARNESAFGWCGHTFSQNVVSVFMCKLVIMCLGFKKNDFCCSAIGWWWWRRLTPATDIGKEEQKKDDRHKKERNEIECARPPDNRASTVWAE